MDRAEELLEIKIKNTILVNWLVDQINTQKGKGYSYLDVNEVMHILIVIGFYPPMLKADEPPAEILKAWGDTEVLKAQEVDNE